MFFRQIIAGFRPAYKLFAGGAIHALQGKAWQGREIGERGVFVFGPQWVDAYFVDASACNNEPNIFAPRAAIICLGYDGGYFI